MGGKFFLMSKKGTWIWQKAGFELGNFVMLTPALQLLNGMNGKPIKVFFDNNYISELYKVCPFLRILTQKPDTIPRYCTKSPPRNRHESDTEAWCRLYAKQRKNLPSPYIDPPSRVSKLVKEDGKKYVAVIHGCHNKSVFQDRKDVGKKILSHTIKRLIENGLVPVIIGNKSDKNKFWKKIDLDGCIDYLGKFKLKKSVDILNSCDYFIANDTGLYHIAAALHKTGLVLWKKTDYDKNREASKKISHCRNRSGSFDVYKNFVDTHIEKWR